MSKPNTKIKFTYQDYKSLPYHETKQYELQGGELTLIPSPSTYHQRISRRIEFLLINYVEQKDLGEVLDAPIDVILSKHDVVQPDILFVSKHRANIIGEKAIQGAPDLVIEILSPGTEEYDRKYKRTLYSSHGVREYWIVDPDQKTVAIFSLAESGFEIVATYQKSQTLKSPLLKDLALDLREVF